MTEGDQPLQPDRPDVPVEPPAETPGDAAWSPPDGEETAPAEPPLQPRPLRVFSAIGRSLDLYIWRPVLFIGIGLISGLLSAGFSLIAYRGSEGPLVGLLASLVVSAIALATSLATMIAADDLRAGRPASLGSVAGRAIGNLVPTMLAVLAFGFVGAGLGIVIGLPVVLLARTAPLVALVGLITLMVVLVGVLFRWSLALPAIALEGRGVIASFRRSSQLLRGNLLRLLAIWIVLGVLVGPLSISVGLLSATGTDALLAFALALLLGLVAAPLSGILFTTIFGDLAGRPDTGGVEVDRAGRTIIVAGVLVLGLAGLAIGLPKFAAAIGQIALRGVPAQDRGHIFTGAARNPLDPCHPNAISTTFTTSDQIWIGGYFSETIPPGQAGQIAVYANGQLVTSAAVGSGTQIVGCYYELRPLVGTPPGTYKFVVTFQGRTIGEGGFSVR